MALLRTYELFDERPIKVIDYRSGAPVDISSKYVGSLDLRKPFGRLVATLTVNDDGTFHLASDGGSGEDNADNLIELLTAYSWDLRLESPNPRAI